MASNLEKRLHDLLDRDDILQVIHRIARGLDRVDNDLVLSGYWPEAIDDHTHYVGGPRGFVAYADKMTLSFVSCQHGLMTHNCEIDGNDAHCETYYTFIATAAQPPHFMASGRYVDHFRKRGEEWRILRRFTVVDGTYDLLPSAMTAGMPSPYGPGENPVALDRSDVSYQRPVRTRAPK